MLSLGPIAFAAPWFLVELAALPVIWWLLRATPPAPTELVFPPTRILSTLPRTSETPAHTPWWLLLLRLLIAALVITGLSQPLLNPIAALRSSGPLIIVVDNGWASAADWGLRRTAMSSLIAQAQTDERAVILFPTAASPDIAGESSDLRGLGDVLRPSDAQSIALALEPNPWEPDPVAVSEQIKSLKVDGSANVFWLSDGLQRPGQRELAAALQRLGGLQVFAPNGNRMPKVVSTHTEPTGKRSYVVRRSAVSSSPAETVFLRATDAQGRLISREPAQIAPGEAAVSIAFDIPVELRNRIARIALEGKETAGAVILTDDRWKRRPVGVASGSRLDSGQPLISDDYYIIRALSPFSDIRRGRVRDLVDGGVSVLVLPDDTALDLDERTKIGDWVERGGVLIRFAGPNLAKYVAGQDAVEENALVPVKLRGGDRVLGGALSWSKPARLSPFEETSPFFGLSISEEVTVNRQVLAEPSLELADRTWARLADGTPLVTFTARGKGRLILFHTTSNADWSDLPLSGLFLEMLRRLVELSKGVGDLADSGRLAPIKSMDAYGRLGDPIPGASPIEARHFADVIVGPQHPPGFYGGQNPRRALNLGDHLSGEIKILGRMTDMPSGAEPKPYRNNNTFDLKAPLLAAALIFALLDTMAMLRLQGFGRALSRRGAAKRGLAIAALAAGLSAGDARADESRAMEAALETRMGYIETGIPDRDRITRAGLLGLVDILKRRTAAELAEPHAVNLVTDDLALYPLIYWAIEPDHPRLSGPAIANLNQYTENGGILFIDTRDQAHIGTVGWALRSGVAEGPGARRLVQIARGLRLPPLVPIDPDHVLTKAFYLLQEFPGRYAGGELWVEAPESAARDGVSSIILGSNDYASAWARSAGGGAMFPVIPAGEPQREMAYRVGVNLTMYALTGNYKSDQVHVPAILERLGQ